MPTSSLPEEIPESRLRPVTRRSWPGKERSKNEATRAVDEKIPQCVAPADVGSRRPECFAERSHLDLDSRRQSQRLSQPPARRAKHADSVGLIDHQPRAMGLLELHDFPQGSDVAIHAVDGLDDYQHPVGETSPAPSADGWPAFPGCYAGRRGRLPPLNRAPSARLA